MKIELDGVVKAIGSVVWIVVFFLTLPIWVLGMCLVDWWKKKKKHLLIMFKDSIRKWRGL